MNPGLSLPLQRRFLALGDSYTIGEAVSEEQRWPAQLASRLRGTGEIDLQVTYVAVTGWTTDELSVGMDRAILDPSYDLVSLAIGVNDQYRGRDVAAYRPNFARLLERAIGLAGEDSGQVIVLSIPDWGATPFADDRNPERIGKEIDAYNAIAREICGAAGVEWIDVTDLSRLAEVDPGLVANDGLHPSPRMYATWVDRVEPIARRILMGSQRDPRLTGARVS